MKIDFDAVDSVLNDPERIAAVQNALRPPLPDGVEEITHTLADAVGVPYAAVTVLDDRFQHVLVSSVGGNDTCTRDSSHCQYVVGTGKTLAINNVELVGVWRRLARNLIEGHPLQAYLGVPLVTRYGGREQTLGAVCVVDVQERAWSAQDHMAVTKAAWQIAALMQERQHDDI